MSALEQEIIDKFHQLDRRAKQRVLTSLEIDLHSSFDYAGWWADVESLQAAIQARLGDQNSMPVLSLLNELREESA